MLGAFCADSPSWLRQGKDGNLVLIGTMPVPHSKEAPKPLRQQD